MATGTRAAIVRWRLVDIQAYKDVIVGVKTQESIHSLR
jgi:hypothetical protein